MWLTTQSSVEVGVQKLVIHPRLRYSPLSNQKRGSPRHSKVREVGEFSYSTCNLLTE